MAGLPHLPALSEGVRVCRLCGDDYWRLTWVQPPLPGIRSGYGEGRRLVLDVCRCGVRPVAVQSVNPRAADV